MTSVISDFVLETSTCHSQYQPLQSFDNIAEDRLSVGTSPIYCMLASNSRLNYASGYSCVTDKVVLREATVRVRITAGRTSLPASGITVSWEVHAPINSTEDSGTVITSGSDVTNRDGRHLGRSHLR